MLIHQLVYFIVMHVGLHLVNHNNHNNHHHLNNSSKLLNNHNNQKRNQDDVKRNKNKKNHKMIKIIMVQIIKRIINQNNHLPINLNSQSNKNPNNKSKIKHHRKYNPMIITITINVEIIKRAVIKTIIILTIITKESRNQPINL